VFVAGLSPGTYEVSGPETSYDTCGLCIQVFTGESGRKFYFAEAGELTLTSISPMTGSASNLAFTEIDMFGQKVASDCRTRIGSIAFETRN
jgi:hypothetical protein